MRKGLLTFLNRLRKPWRRGNAFGISLSNSVQGKRVDQNDAQVSSEDQPFESR